MANTVFVDPARWGYRHCNFAHGVVPSERRNPIAALFEQPTPNTDIHLQADAFATWATELRR